MTYATKTAQDVAHELRGLPFRLQELPAKGEVKIFVPASYLYRVTQWAGHWGGRQVGTALTVHVESEPGQEPFVPAEPKINWRPTCELRFLAIEYPQYMHGPILQQKWITDDASQEEWRAVPFVTQKGE